MIKKLAVKYLAKLGYKLNRIQSLDLSEEQTAVARAKLIIQKISPDFTILNGPFKGMMYPSIDITELTLAPKITGSYEAQLNPLIARLSENHYDHILDIGCAEGYYAVGFARMFPESTVHCYDVNELDLEFCRKMALLNGTSNMTYNNFCSPDTLIHFDYGTRSLILCDCEGYELELFTPEVIRNLSKTDVLIEMHDIANPVISKTLLERFGATHTATVVNNSNLNNSNLQGLDELNTAERAYASFEHRGGVHRNIFMEWVLFNSKYML